MTLAAGLKIKVLEAEVRVVEDLLRFDEAFLTNSVLEIMPLVAIRERTARTIAIGTGRPGTITKRLMSAYREMVARETR